MFRKRTYALIGAGVVAGLLAFVIPAFGSHDGGDAILFSSADGVAEFTYPGLADQTVTTASNGCQITNAGPGTIMTAASTGGVPGLNDLSIGVKANGRNANGTPCSQVDGAETLTMTPGSLLAGRKFSGVSLDLEMTGNAIVVLTFADGSTSKVYTLHTGTNFQSLCGSQPTANGCMTNSDDNVSTAAYEVTSDDDDLVNACAAPNSSGPNNQGNDNCIWTIDPAGEYSSVKLTVQNVGTVSLESGADTGYPSHFYIANAAPVAGDDTVTTDEDTSTGTIDLKANDSDADGDDLIISAVDTTGTTGSVTLSGGNVSYDPNGNFETLGTGQTASDSFGYTVSDGNGGSDTATVSVTINGVNDAPVINNTSTSTTEGNPANVDLGVTDPDDSSFTTSCTSDVPGSFVDDGDGTGSFTTTDPEYSGLITLQCTVSDGEASDTENFAITVAAVNDPPVAVDDEAFIDAATTANVLIDVLANDTDIDGPSLTVSAADTTGSNGGSITVAADGSSLTYTPPPNFTGSDTFNYTVSDGEFSDTGTVTVYELFECNETLSVTDGTISASYERLNGGGCDGKPYSLDIDEITAGLAVHFQPRPQSGTPVNDCSDTPEDCDAEFKATLIFGPRIKDNAPDTGTLYYDPVAQDDPNAVVLREMPWCVFDPFADGVTDRRAALPEGDSWCIVSVSTTIASGTQTTTEWITYGIGDPWKIAT